MKPAHVPRTFAQRSRFLLAALGLLILASCRMNEAEGDQYLRLNLSPSLAGYDRVRIDLVSPEDSGVVYEEIWNARLEDPAGFPRHKLTAARGRDFVIRIRAYDAQGGLAMAKDVEVRGRQARPTVVIRADLRLLTLTPSHGNLSPPFDPETEDYALEVADSVTSLGFTVESMDDGNTLDLDGRETAWGAVPPFALQPGTRVLAFRVQDKQGGASRTYRVSVRQGVNQAGAPVVRILSPANGLVTNRDTLLVSWTVDSVPQVEGTREILAAPDGPKIILREKRGPDGKVGQAEVRVTRDTEPPRKPEASAVTPTASARPEWSWGPVEGGNGVFRHRLDTADLAGRPEVESLSFSPDRDLAPGVHTFHLQARDAAGNWSETESFAVTVLGKDVTPPQPPRLRGTTPTNVLPRWIWSPGGGDGIGAYEVKLGDGDFDTGATATRDTAYTLPGPAVAGTAYTLYVRERDSAGNWSEPANHAIEFDDTRISLAIQSPRESGTHYYSEALVSLAGTVSGPHAIAKVTYRLDAGTPVSAGFASGLWSIPGLALAEGVPVTVTVAAEDVLGAASETRLVLHRDTTSPGAPTLINQPPASQREPKATWTWIAGGDGPSGSGLSGRFRYRLNDGAWVNTTALLAADLPLADGANILSVQNEDRAGNWSPSAQGAARLDSTRPLLSITSPASNPAALAGLKVTLAGSASDAGSGIASVTVAGQESGPAAATVTGGTWRSAELTLKPGSNELRVTATDGLGNATVVTLAATVTLSVPTVVITYPPAGFVTNKDTVTLRYRVDGGAEITAPAPETLPVGSTVLTQSSPPNEAGVRGSATVTVVRDIQPPNAPSLSAASALTRGDPVWNWTSNGDAAGGGGLPATPVFRYRLDGGTPVQVSVRTFRPTGASEGTHTLSVSEQDRAGNWGPYSPDVAVRVDRTAPVLTLQSPQDGFITNRDTVTVTYLVKDGAAAAVTRTRRVTLAGGSVSVPVELTEMDSAGNTGTASLILYRRSNVLFVRPAATGVGDGSSWSDALGSISTALSRAVAGTQIWVAAGAYSAPALDSGFALLNGVSIYGSFNPSGSAKSVEERTFAAADTSVITRSVTTARALFNLSGGSSTYLSQVVLDGFRLHVHPGMEGVILNRTYFITLRNLNFVSESGAAAPGKALTTYLSSDVLGENLKFSKFNTMSFVVKVSGAMDFKNIEFAGNGIPAAAAGALVSGGRDMTFEGCRFLDAVPSTFRHIEQTHPDGVLSITETTFRLANPSGGITAAARWETANPVFSGNSFVP